MNLIILLPALACCVALARGSAQKALINVYLPAVLLLPQYFYLRYPHLPPLTFADAAMLPLGVAMVWTQMRRWRWSWMDLWVLLFAASAALSEGLNTLAANGGLQLFAELMTVVLPYMAGKLLIEQDVRREGFEGHPGRRMLMAGMIFLMGVFYCLWLRGFAPNWGRRRLVEGLPVTGRGLALAAIAAGLLMTQSRGPWVGVGLALIFALLTRVLPWGKAAMVFALLVMALAMGAYSFGKQYTEKELSQASNEEQRDAIYRRDLLRNYAPIIMERKAFGWGISAHPEVNGQTSIDNEFLMLAVTQGFTGLGLFLAIVAGTATQLFRLAGRPLWPEDRGLVFAQLAILIGLMITLLTVFLGEQTLILFFLIAGWVQAMNPVALGEGSGNTSAQRFRFNRVMT